MNNLYFQSAASRLEYGLQAYRASDQRDYILVGFELHPGEEILPMPNADLLKWIPNHVWGPQDGVSMIARLLGGSDQVTIYSGDNNWVNTNWDDDKLFLEGGMGIARGGIGNDFIQVTGGFWNIANGNEGNDEIINYAKVAGNLRGGIGNDVLINGGGASGYFWGDAGADTFRPYVLDQNGYIGDDTQMVIKDFEVGIDTLDLSMAGGAIFTHIDGDTYIGSSYANLGLIAIVENVLL